MKKSAIAIPCLLLLLLAVQAVKAEVIFFDDSHSGYMIPPLTPRWTPGHSGGICSASSPVGVLCGPGSGSEESVWGYLAPPREHLTLDTDLSHYDILHPAIPFNDFLWVTEQEIVDPNLFGDYLYSFTYVDAIYLQFNSAFASGFQCTASLVPTDCAHPRTIAETDGIVTAGYVRWSDGSFDQITFMSTDAHAVFEPPSLLLVGTGFILLFRRYRKPQPQLA